MVKDGATPQVKRAAVRCNVEIFLDKELMFNVTKHEVNLHLYLTVRMFSNSLNKRCFYLKTKDLYHF